jgi:hypothetical protein
MDEPLITRLWSELEELALTDYPTKAMFDLFRYRPRYPAAAIQPNRSGIAVMEMLLSIAVMSTKHRKEIEKKILEHAYLRPVPPMILGEVASYNVGFNDAINEIVKILNADADIVERISQLKKR